MKANQDIIRGLVMVMSLTTAVAANNSPFGPDGVFASLFSDLTQLISSGLIALIIGMTIAMFFWALFRGMLRSQSGADINKNKDTLIWGIGILFVMVSIWGIIIFFQDAILGSKYKGKTVELPTIPLVGKSNTPASANNPLTPANTGSTNTSKKSVGAACGKSSECVSGICAADGGGNTNLKCQAPSYIDTYIP